MLADTSANLSSLKVDQKNNNKITNLNTLLKSKSCLDRLSNKITANKDYINLGKNNCTWKSIQQTAKEIKNTIDAKIQTNFTNILNFQTKVCMIHPMDVQIKDKEEATKKLMQDYWQKKLETESQTKKKTILQSRQNKQNKQTRLPKLKSSEIVFQQKQNKPKKKAVLSSFNVKAYEKQREMQYLKKNNEQKILTYLYSYIVQVVEYKVQNDTPEFLLFQKINYTKWDSIDSILKRIQGFCKKYEIKYCTLDLQKVMQLIDTKIKTQKILKPSNVAGSPFSLSNIPTPQKQFTSHELLGCLQNSEQISANNCKKAGIRFYGTKGKLRAIIKIQSVWKGKIVYQRIKKLRQTVKRVIKIQKGYQIYKKYLKTKQTIKQGCIQKYKWFKEKQKKFTQTYRLNELTKKIKYEIHICQDSQSQWQRFSTQRFVQKQNSYLTRIFRAFKQQSAIQTRIIYVTASPISKQILNYYSKLLQLGGASNFRSRIIFMSARQCTALADKVPLSRLLYYCPSVLKKIKNIIQNNYAYIVPSTPSIDFVNLCHYLDVPIYSANPQVLLSLQTVSGCKDLIQNINNSNDIYPTLPFAKNIYSLKYLISQLTMLILSNPQVGRWVFKIDNQFNSRGLAYVEVTKLLPKKIIKFIRKVHSQSALNSTSATILPQFNALTQQVFNLIYQAFNEGDRLTLVNNSAYRDQDQFLSFYFANGGVVQAQINTTGEETQTQCFCIDIQPDNQWKFVCSYKKISIKKRSPCCYYETQLSEPHDQIQSIVKQLIRKKCYGYFVLDFVKQAGRQQDAKRKTYFNGIKCYLDSFSSASYMRQFVSRDSNALYIPYIPHENIKKITMSTFFHLCRLQNISFDIERKIGNIFMFLDGLESGCLGIMTFNNSSKIQTFIHAAQVLDFFNSKVGNTPISSPPEEFLIIRNAINGYLNFLRKKKNALKSNTEIVNVSERKLKKMMSYKQREYLQ